jgi:hypothetical protein
VFAPSRLRLPSAAASRKWNTCTPTATSRFSIRYRSAISSAPRFATLARSASRDRVPSSRKLTKGQRLDAPYYLRKPLLPWPMGHGCRSHQRRHGPAAQPRRLLRHQLGGVELFLGDTGGARRTRTRWCSPETAAVSGDWLIPGFSRPPAPVFELAPRKCVVRLMCYI